MEEIIKELTEVNKDLLRDFGTKSYELRCKIHDIKEELSRKQTSITHKVILDFAHEWNNTDEPLISDDFIANYLNVE